MRILLRGNQSFSKPKSRKLTTQEHISTMKKNSDVNNTLNESGAQTSFQEKELHIKNLTLMNENDPNDLKKNLKRASSSHYLEVRRNKKRIWEDSEDSDSSIDDSSLEGDSSWTSLPQHCLVSCLSGGDHDISWITLSETSNISVEVRPKRCIQHSDCQDAACQASRANALVPQNWHTTSTSSVQDNFDSSDLLSSEDLAMILLDFEEFLIPFVHCYTHDYLNLDFPIIPTSQDELSNNEINQPEYSIVTSERTVITSPISSNGNLAIDGITSQENNPEAKLMTDSDNYQQAKNYSTILTDEDLNEDVFAAVEEFLKNYSSVQCKFIDFELPDDF